MNKEVMPKYRKQTGRYFDQAFVGLNDSRYYLGEYEVPESRQEYRRLLAQWAINGRQTSIKNEDITVVELLAQLWRYAQSYYRRSDGTLTTEISNYRQALRQLKKLYCVVRR